MKAILIDRDGVINRDPGGWTKFSYVTEPKDFHFLPGALKALKLLKNARVKVIIVSNQAGVAKGHFTKVQLAAVNSFMLEKVGAAGGKIEEAFYCVHRDEDNCACRKPKAGMFDAAMKKYGIDPRETFVIGDSYVDILAGREAGLKTVFILSGKHTVESIRKHGAKPNYVFKDLLEAVTWILGKEKRRFERSIKRKIEKKRGPAPSGESAGSEEEGA